jgi:hypothetical protein
MAALLTCGATLLHIFTADRACSGLWPSHEPDQAHDYEDEEPKKDDERDADVLVAVAAVLIVLCGTRL